MDPEVPLDNALGARAEVAPAPQELEAICLRLLELARSRARSLGVDRDQVEDYALGCVAHLLPQLPDLPVARFLPAAQDAYLVRCADNWVKNALRKEQYRQRFECCWQSAEPLIESAHDPFVRILRQEFWLLLLAAVEHLSLPQQELFVACYLLERSQAEIAAATGRSPNAIRRALWALRRRLRHILKAQGLPPDEADDYIRHLTPPP